MKHATRYSCLFAAVALNACSEAQSASTEQATTQSEDTLSTCTCPTSVPAVLNPSADQTIKYSYTGEGVQIYICNATTTGGYAWTFVAPQANLIGDDGRLLGTHFIGPTWQSNDGSSVVGAKVAGATVDTSAVPWLLLSATSHGTTQGRFSDVTSIQRLNTVGGIAPPATDCDSTHAGSIVQVPYTALYVLYKTKEHGKVRQCAGS